MKRPALTILAFALLSILMALRAAAALEEPKPGRVDPRHDAFDGTEQGFEGVTIDLKAIDNAFEPYGEEIERWERFLSDAQFQEQGLQAGTIKGGATELARVNQEIVLAKNQIEMLTAAEKTRNDAEHCGLNALLSDWQNLKDVAENAKANVEPAANMELPPPPASGGAAATALLYGSQAVLRRQLERYDEIVGLVDRNHDAIVDTCEKAKIKKALDTANAKAAMDIVQADAVARTGKFSDMNTLVGGIYTTVAAARANQIVGDPIGAAQWQATVDTLGDFVEAAADTCMDQAFDPLAAISLGRQAQLTGMGDEPASNPVPQPSSKDDEGFMSDPRAKAWYEQAQGGTKHQPPSSEAVRKLTDLCVNRLFETAGMAGGLLYHMRHCGKDLTGTWEMEVTVNDSKFYGEGEAGPFTQVQNETPAPGVIVTYVSKNADAPIEASGIVTTPVDKIPEHIHGTFGFEINTSKRGPMLFERTMYMRSNMVTDSTVPLNTTPIPVVPSVIFGGTNMLEMPVMVINGNRPCDPQKDVFKDYPGY